jgi:site-specific recombinase XerC
LQLEEIDALSIAAYIEKIGGEKAKPSVKQQLAALRQMFDYLVTGGILSINPAASVRGPKYVVRRGKTPVPSADQARHLLDTIDPAELIGLRDRGLIGLMVFSFARVGAANTLRVGDFFENEKLVAKVAGERRQAPRGPCHHSLRKYLDVWIKAAEIGADKKAGCYVAFARETTSRATGWTRTTYSE